MPKLRRLNAWVPGECWRSWCTWKLACWRPWRRLGLLSWCISRFTIWLACRMTTHILILPGCFGLGSMANGNTHGVDLRHLPPLAVFPAFDWTWKGIFLWGCAISGMLSLMCSLTWKSLSLPKPVNRSLCSCTNSSTWESDHSDKAEVDVYHLITRALIQSPVNL